MNSPEQDADNLINEFLESLYNNGELSFKKILYPKAVNCAKICVNKMLSNTGVDRAYTHWSNVKEILDKK